MPYTAPATVVTATTITTAWGNSVKAAADYLANPPVCRVRHSANQSVTNGTSLYLAWDTEDLDTDTMHDTVTNNSRITFKTAGVYVITCNVLWVAGNDFTGLGVTLEKNAITPIASAQVGTVADNNINIGLSATTIAKFAVNDYVRAAAFQRNSAVAARNLLADQRTHFEAVWVGLG